MLHHQRELLSSLASMWDGGNARDRVHEEGDCMCWLLCAYEENGRSPRLVVFKGTTEQLGWARAGVAKLNDKLGWVCTYDEFGLHDEYPESKYLIERDTVMLSEWFDEGVCRTHPMTGEPVVPPECFTATCRAAYEGDVMDAFSGLFKSRGWVGEMSATRVMP